MDDNNSNNDANEHDEEEEEEKEDKKTKSSEDGSPVVKLVFFGHSVGALIAYETLRNIQDRFGVIVSDLSNDDDMNSLCDTVILRDASHIVHYCIFSSCPNPAKLTKHNRDRFNTKFFCASNSELLAYVAKLGIYQKCYSSIHNKIFTNRILSTAFDGIRADLKLLEKYFLRGYKWRTDDRNSPTSKHNSQNGSGNNSNNQSKANSNINSHNNSFKNKAPPNSPAKNAKDKLYKAETFKGTGFQVYCSILCIRLEDDEMVSDSDVYEWCQFTTKKFHEHTFAVGKQMYMNDYSNEWQAYNSHHTPELLNILSSICLHDTIPGVVEEEEESDMSSIEDVVRLNSINEDDDLDD